MKSERTMVWFSMFFIVFGAIFFGIGAFVLKDNMEFKKDAVVVSAEIVDIESYRDRDGDRRHYVFVSYSYAGENYDYVSLDAYTSGMHVGKVIDVLVNPDYPSEVKSTAGIYILPAVFMLVGGVVLAVGIVILVRDISKRIGYKRLLTTGKSLQAVVERIEMNRHYSVNGRHPFVVYCTYKDEYQDMTYRFKSHNLWENPEPALMVGGYVKVMVNPSDYSKYYVCAQEAMSQRIMDFTGDSFY